MDGCGEIRGCGPPSKSRQIVIKGYRCNYLSDKNQRHTDGKLGVLCLVTENEHGKKRTHTPTDGSEAYQDGFGNTPRLPYCTTFVNTVKEKRYQIDYEKVNHKIFCHWTFKFQTAKIAEICCIIRISPDLKPKHSHSVNLSADFAKQWHNAAVDVLLEGFFTALNDVFVLTDAGHDEDGNLLLVRQNGSGARVAGLNVEVKYIPIRNLELQAGFTYQQSRYRKPEQWSETVEAQTKMFRSPDTYGFLMLYYSPVKRLDLSLTGTYTGRMLIQHFAGYIENDREEVSKPFFDLNFKIAYGIKLKDNMILEVSLGMKNIFNSYQKDFDKGELRDAGYIYGPVLPRSLFAGVKFSL